MRRGAARHLLGGRPGFARAWPGPWEPRRVRGSGLAAVKSVPGVFSGGRWTAALARGKGAGQGWLAVRTTCDTVEGSRRFFVWLFGWIFGLQPL